MDERAIYTESDGMRALVDIEGYFSAMFDVLNSDETKRSHAACFAMAGLLAHGGIAFRPSDGPDTIYDATAQHAVVAADALLAALNKPE